MPSLTDILWSKTASLDKLKDMRRELYKAAKAGRSWRVRHILRKPTSIHTIPDRALVYAAEHGHLDTVKALMDCGANLRNENDLALRYAAKGGHTDIVKFCLEQGADPDAADEQALKWAAGNGKYYAARMLLYASAEAYTLDKEEALRAANLNGHEDSGQLIADWLKRHDPDGTKHDTLTNKKNAARRKPYKFRV